MNGSGNHFRHFRLRHGLSQARLAGLVGVQPKRLAAWERGIDEPDTKQILKLVDLSHRLPGELLASLATSVSQCALPRALCRTGRLNLRAISGPAIDKRPSIAKLIGCDLVPIACGVLKAMLDDRVLQRAIVKREVAGVVATTTSVLRTTEAEEIGTWRTTINYFFHDGVIYSDAIAVPASPDERSGYTPILVDELGSDLFGDRDALEAALAAPRARAR